MGLLLRGAPGIENLIEARRADYRSRSEISVISMSYQNPFNLKISFDGGGIARILEIIRDWSADRRAAQARARIAEAQASDYEDRVRVRAELRDVVFRGLIESDQLISHDEIAALLSDERIDALLALEAAAPTIEIGPDVTD